MRQALTKQRILQAALKLAGEQGIEGLSMRKLAQVLDVKAMSLYNHVANKEALLHAMVDSIIGEIDTNPLSKFSNSKAAVTPKSWVKAMLVRGNSFRAVLLIHPWVTMEVLSRINIGPAMLSFVDTTLGCLQKAGFDIVTADRIWNGMDSYIFGFTLQELNCPFEQEDYAEVAESGMDIVPADIYRNLNKLSQAVMNGQYNGIQQFEHGFKLLLAGYESIRQ
jgi:AcrR family transcriptional regulator